MDLKLGKQWALVTGSSRGIGRGIAEAFLREDSNVILVDRDRMSLEATRDEFASIYGPERVIGLEADLLQPEGISDLTELVSDQVGQLNHLVCNIGSGASVPPLEEDSHEMQRMLDINFTSAFGVVHELTNILEKSSKNAQSSSSITFTGSICGVDALGCPVGYASAKAALISYANNISRPMGQRGIRVNVVSPGNILFPGSTWDKKLQADRQSVESMLEQDVPLRRLGTIDEVADIIVFLASYRCGFVSGANWIVDGGQVRSI